MNALDDTQCGLQIPFPLACGCHWGCSFAATSYGQGGLFGNRHLSRRCLSPHRFLFWILVSPLGLESPLVCIHGQGEYEVGLYVPVLIGRRPEAYRYIRPLLHALRKLLQLVLQHGCGGIPSEVRKGDLMSRLPPGWPAPHSMEPETPKPKGSQWFTSFLHDLLASHVQEDRVWHRDWHHFAHLRDGDQYEAGGIQLVRQILTGGRSMPHIQMHVCNAKGLRGYVVRLIHEPHSHRQCVLLVEHALSHG